MARGILFANIMDGIIMVVTNKSIVKSHLDFTKFFFIFFVFELIILVKINTFAHSAKSCHYAAALSTEAPILSLPSDILSFPG